MTRRILPSIAFLIGGALTWYVLSLLHTFAHAEAGMSAGPIPVPPTADALIPWFACAYFAVSALSVLVAQKRAGLWVAATISHLMLLIAFCLVCSEAADEGWSKLLSGAFTLAFIMAVFYSPWISIWVGLILSARKDTA